MKALLCISFLSALFSGCRPPTKSDLWIASKPFQQWCKTALQSDSGFISARLAQQLEILICQSDTSILPFEHCGLYATNAAELIPPTNVPESTDSSGGKYFQLLTKGEKRWILCLNINLEGYESPYVFEIQQQYNQFILASWTNYHHGNYACCWNGPIDGFYQLGPYFLLNTCGRGSGFCAGCANVLFSPLHPDSPQYPGSPAIPVSWFQGGCAWPEDRVLKRSLHLKPEKSD